MEWVNPATRQKFEIESGRGAGRNCPGFSDAPYPLSASLVATKLAEMNMEEINENIRTGKIQVGHVNKRGKISSIIYRGRRIRLRTIQGLAKSANVPFSNRANSGDFGKQQNARRLARRRIDSRINFP
jgi:hypothetical protein